eukprot:5707171-Pyramimonas_sp.AAC.1
MHTTCLSLKPQSKEPPPPTGASGGAGGRDATAGARAGRAALPLRAGRRARAHRELRAHCAGRAPPRPCAKLRPLRPPLPPHAPGQQCYEYKYVIIVLYFKITSYLRVSKNISYIICDHKRINQGWAVHRLGLKYGMVFYGV